MRGSRPTARLGCPGRPLHAAGCAKVYAEKVSGGKKPTGELGKLLRRLEPGDVVMVTRLDRLARSTRDMLNILHDLGERGVGFSRWPIAGPTRRRLMAGCW